MLQQAFVCVCIIASPSLATATDYASQPAPEIKNPGQAQLLDVARAGQRLVAVGEHGLIAYSDDDGKSWTQASVPVSWTLTAVDFPTAEHGWAVGHGGVILHSGNAGVSWQLQFDGNKAIRINIAFAKTLVQQLKDEAQAASDDRTNRDRTDEDTELTRLLEDAELALEDAVTAEQTGANDPFLDVWFKDTQTGFAVGAYGMLYRTSNGGLQWETLAGGISNLDAYHYYGIAANSRGQLFLCGETGILYRSDDNGGNWQRLKSPYDGSLFGIAVATDNSVVTYGLRGNVFYSNDQGISWEKSAQSQQSSLFASARLRNGDLVLLGAAGAMLVSSDNGQSFTSANHTSRGSFAGAATTTYGGLLVAGLDGAIVIPAANPAKR